MNMEEALGLGAALLLLFLAALINRKPGHKLKDDLRMIECDVVDAERIVENEVKKDIKEAAEEVTYPIKRAIRVIQHKTITFGGQD